MPRPKSSVSRPCWRRRARDEVLRIRKRFVLQFRAGDEVEEIAENRLECGMSLAASASVNSLLTPDITRAENKP